MPPKKQSRHFILKAPVWESMARIIRFALAIVSSILSPGKVSRSGPTGVNAGKTVRRFPGAKIHQRSWHEGPVTWGLFCRHQAWVGLSAGGRPIGKYRQWAMGFQPLGFPLFVGKLVFAQLMDFLPLHSFVAVSVLSIELSAKNFFIFGSVSVHGVHTTDVPRKSGCDVPVIVEIGGAALLALSL